MHKESWLLQCHLIEQVISIPTNCGKCPIPPHHRTSPPDQARSASIPLPRPSPPHCQPMEICRWNLRQWLEYLHFRCTRALPSSLHQRRRCRMRPAGPGHASLRWTFNECQPHRPPKEGLFTHKHGNGLNRAHTTVRSRPCCCEGPSGRERRAKPRSPDSRSVIRSSAWFGRRIVGRCNHPLCRRKWCW